MAKYRIYRTDPRNITIQRQRPSGKRWDTISYHGNSPHSLRLGLFDLIMSQYTPDDENLLKQLKKLELALISGMDRVEKLIEEYVYGQTS